MKKLLTLAAAAFLVGSASAVTMQWGTSTAVAFGGSNLRSDPAVIGYLIATDSLDSSGYDLASFSISDIGTQVNSYTGGTTALSRLSNRWTIDTDHYDNGDTFAVLLKYEKDGTTYYNLSSALVTMSGMALDPPTNASNTSSAFAWTTATGSTLAAGGGWTAVPSDIPEPATGALALAGIALLFKRRRA